MSGTEPRSLWVLVECATTELYPSHMVWTFNKVLSRVRKKETKTPGEVRPLKSAVVLNPRLRSLWGWQVPREVPQTVCMSVAFGDGVWLLCQPQIGCGSEREMRHQLNPPLRACFSYLGPGTGWAFAA